MAGLKEIKKCFKILREKKVRTKLIINGHLITSKIKDVHWNCIELTSGAKIDYKDIQDFRIG